MSDKEILALYSGLVPFLASTFGQSCEIVLHDLTDTDQSVIAIENGFNSGRAVGSPITDLAQRFIKNFAKYETNEAGKALVPAGPQL